MVRYRRVAIPALPYLDSISERGIAVDLEVQGVERARLEGEIQVHSRGLSIYYEGINWSSDAQVKAVFQQLGIKRSGYKTDGGKDALHGLARKALVALNPEYKEMLTWFDAFRSKSHTLSRLPGLTRHVRSDGRIHPRFHLAGPKTTRLSATGPAIQTFEKAMKRCIVPSPGMVLLEADYSGIEILWMAFLSQDPRLLEIVREGRSLHTEVAEELGIPRPVAKTLNFGSSYGAGAQTLKELFDKEMEWGTTTEAECQDMILGRRRMFARFEEWKREQEERAQKTHQVESVFGAVRRLPAASAGGREGGEALRQASNAPIQSAASDMCLLRGLDLAREMPSLRTLTLTHDAILWEVEDPVEAARKIRPIMENPAFYWGRLDPAPTVEFQTGMNWAKFDQDNPKDNPDGMKVLYVG